jgi:hypothetical protein
MRSMGRDYFPPSIWLTSDPIVLVYGVSKVRSEQGNKMTNRHQNRSWRLYVGQGFRIFTNYRRAVAAYDAAGPGAVLARGDDHTVIYCD